MKLKLSRLSATGLIRLVAEAVLLFLVAWSPWPFASHEFEWEAVLIGGVALLILLWLAYAFFHGHIAIRPDGIVYCLAGLVLLSLLQLVPLPESVVGILSPTRLQLHHQLIPQILEQLPGEPGGVARSTWLPLTFDPFKTRVFLGQTLSLLLLYLVVRSWLASRDALRRLAWVAAINGILLALLALAQFFSSPHSFVYWQVDTIVGDVFGPFICKNNYPDYVLFCLGMSMSLLVSRQPTKSVKVRGVTYQVSTIGKLSDSPDLFLLGGGSILMMVSIPFTLSRGGMLGTVIAVSAVTALVLHTRGKVTRGIAIGGAVLFGALLLGGWFGWGLVSDRIETLWTKKNDTRSELWSDVSTLVPKFLAAGSGNGSFPRIEPSTRSEASPDSFQMENAHNEYLEAILEGGLIRLALTLAICCFAVRTTIKAYLRLKDRSSGSILLGILFGQIGLIVHSFVDFGIHMPAVAFIAAVMTAFAADAASDPSYIPAAKKSAVKPPLDPGRRRIAGAGLPVAAAILAALALWDLNDASDRGQAYQLKIVARNAVRAGKLDQYRVRLEALNTAVELTPTDAVAWALLAQVHFEIAQDERRLATMALLGAPAVFGMPLETTVSTHGEHTEECLRAARTARGYSPMLTRPHLLLALANEGFTQSEPSRVHLERATRTCPTDPEIWLLRGLDAARRGDATPAIADWQKAVALDPSRLTTVLTFARKTLSTDQILSQLLPVDPLVGYNAMQQFYPSESNDRRDYLERIAALDSRGDWSARGWAAIARARAELGQDEYAGAAWSKALAKDPESYELRDGLSRWLEGEERYAAAEEHLVWLRNHRDSQDVLDRLDAARHALKLQALIEGR